MDDDERFGDRTEVGHFDTDDKGGSTGTTVRSPSSISCPPARPRTPPAQAPVSPPSF
jgi:hypothetical protein